MKNMKKNLIFLSLTSLSSYGLLLANNNQNLNIKNEESTSKPTTNFYETIYPTTIKFKKIEKENSNFYRLSDSTGILKINDFQGYFFNSTKINQSNKGFINLNKKILNFYRLSDTTGILKDFENKSHLFEII